MRMNRTLPEKIVAVVEALAEELADWCVAGRDRTLAEHEEAVLERVRAVLPLLLRAVVEQATSGLDVRLVRAREACPGCGQKVEPHGRPRRRQLATQCGTVTLERPWYHCWSCGHGWSVVETTLGVASGARVSEGLRAWLVRLGAAAPFREAAEVLDALTGLELGAETIRRHAEAAGTALRAAEDAAVAEVERTREPAEALDPAPGFLVVQTDGAMVRYQDGWHEVKLGLVAGWDDGALQAPSYVAAREPAAAFGARLAAEAARRGALAIDRWEGGVTGRGLAVLRELGLYGDGAAWIWALADERFDARIEVVDPYHAYQHLHAAARALFGDTPAATEWVDRRKADLLTAGVEPVLTALRTKAPTPEATALLRRERGYFTTNAERMDYPSLRLDGLPLGSGAIESAADHLVQRRMKRAGMRWSDPGGDAILALRARLRSKRPLTPPSPRSRLAARPRSAAAA
jgi:Uncharacterised protein family (UPF0236)